MPRREEPVQDVVLIRRHPEADRCRQQSHFLRQPARQHIAKISRRHNELHGRALIGRRLQIGPEVIDTLGENARDVDAVDGGEVDRIGEFRIGKHLLHQRLRIIECPLDRHRVHIRRSRAGHLALLQWCHPTLRIENENGDPVLPQTAMDRRRSRVPGRGPQHREPMPRLLHLALVEQSQQLQGEIFKRQRRTMEKFQHRQRGRERHQRCHVRMAEGPISLGGQRAPFLNRDLRGKRLEKLRRQFCITQPLPTLRDPAKIRQRIRQEQPAVRCQPRRHSFGE